MIGVVEVPPQTRPRLGSSVLVRRVSTSFDEFWRVLTSFHFLGLKMKKYCLIPMEKYLEFNLNHFHTFLMPSGMRERHFCQSQTQSPCLVVLRTGGVDSSIHWSHFLSDSVFLKWLDGYILGLEGWYDGKGENPIFDTTCIQYVPKFRIPHSDSTSMWLSFCWVLVGFCQIRPDSAGACRVIVKSFNKRGAWFHPGF